MSTTAAHLHIQAKLLAALSHNLSQLVHAPLLRELVEHTHLACFGRVLDGDLRT